MKNIVSSSIIVPTDIKTIWDFVSDFNDASHQTIAVVSTDIDGDNRTVTFKNGHQVTEQLQEKIEGKSIKWLQQTTKGFIPIKDVENEIDLEKVDGGTKITFAFHYNTIMGPIGMMMNIMMVKGKLKGYADFNLRKFERKFK